jgi:hypothetical protein
MQPTSVLAVSFNMQHSHLLRSPVQDIYYGQRASGHINKHVRNDKNAFILSMPFRLYCCYLFLAFMFTFILCNRTGFKGETDTDRYFA